MKQLKYLLITLNDCGFTLCGCYSCLKVCFAFERGFYFSRPLSPLLPFPPSLGLPSSFLTCLVYSFKGYSFFNLINSK